MRLVRKNNVFVFDCFGEGDFIDTPDIRFKIDILSGVSFWNSIKIYWQKKRFAKKNTYIAINAWQFLMNKKRIIESIDLNNSDKYFSENVRSFCPIEKIVAKFCQTFNQKCRNWMFVIRQDEYRIRIISGVNESIINSRTVKVTSNYDVSKELIKSQKFISRTVDFNDFDVITNIDISANDNLNIVKFDEKTCISGIQTPVDAWEMLLRFADKYEVYESIFGEKVKKRKKYNILLVLLTFFGACGLTYYCHDSMEVTQNQYVEAKKNAKNLQKKLIKIFTNNDNIRTTSLMYNTISKIKSPLSDLKKIYSSGIGSSSGALKRIKWQKNNNIVIDGDGISEEKINLLNGKIGIGSNGYQRIEVKI